MLDRVAVAIARAGASAGSDSSPGGDPNGLARAAIEAMMEPDETMLLAGNAVVQEIPAEIYMSAALNRAARKKLHAEKMRLRFQAMLRAILNES